MPQDVSIRNGVSGTAVVPLQPSAPSIPTRPIWPHFDEEQIREVTRVLQSGRVNAWTGTEVSDFETAFREMTGASHAIALANGSLSLNLAMECLDLEPGDEVIVTPRSFVISASAVILAGGTPVFADVDPDTQNITPESISAQITKRTVGIIPVHLAGWPCDMPGIMEVARTHGLWVIEDCAQAHGAQIEGRHVGTFADFGSFSFCQDKIISTGGEGGMLVTQREPLWREAWSRKDHGKDYDLVHSQAHPPGFRWLHTRAGTNLRMSGIAAAIGSVQVRRMPLWTDLRHRNAQILADGLRDCPALRVPMPGKGIRHAWYRFYAFTRTDRLKPGWSRDRIIQELAERGQSVFSGSCPEIYNEGVFRSRRFTPASPLPVAHELGHTSLAFRVDPTIEPAEMHVMVQAVRDVMKLATR
ncbi:DegT/DnrJ/EryC1/StrS aminotransferase family protein [Roseivivax sp. THAF30]|uniref:DegT/DnrJ/EryC1/StrS family aminotransferase n=1 Tax=Roseivivax sp. THAF30 TaxID=2587852 RepID=UPI0012679DE7|nr:DegT/DnrJ/EryC1/StrS aminotransferase family protein [Roseivivax sp. THAF30]QFT63710.1 L-glutamine:2-deoxy-scyllo-inosose aminotransferase [Roseivivax sp. THAF30]